MDSPGIDNGDEENTDENELALRDEEDRVLEDADRKEESSLLQEVLNSLKTPLASCSLGMNTVLLEMEGDIKVAEGGELGIEGEEMKEEEPEVDEAVTYQAANTTEEEDEEDIATVSCHDEVVLEEELKDETEEEAEVAAERFSQQCVCICDDAKSLERNEHTEQIDVFYLHDGFYFFSPSFDL